MEIIGLINSVGNGIQLIDLIIYILSYKPRLVKLSVWKKKKKWSIRNSIDTKMIFVREETRFESYISLSLIYNTLAMNKVKLLLFLTLWSGKLIRPLDQLYKWIYLTI